MSVLILVLVLLQNQAHQLKILTQIYLYHHLLNFFIAVASNSIINLTNMYMFLNRCIISHSLIHSYYNAILLYVEKLHTTFFIDIQRYFASRLTIHHGIISKSMQQRQSWLIERNETKSFNVHCYTKYKFKKILRVIRK